MSQNYPIDADPRMTGEEPETCAQCDEEDNSNECVECGLFCCSDCGNYNEDGDFICIAH